MNSHSTTYIEGVIASLQRDAGITIKHYHSLVTSKKLLAKIPSVRSTPHSNDASPVRTVPQPRRSSLGIRLRNT